MGQISVAPPCISRIAITELAASVGWNGSQKTYFDRSSQTFEVGPHGIRPPNLPALWQHAEFEFSNPTKIMLYV